MNIRIIQSNRRRYAYVIGVFFVLQLALFFAPLPAWSAEGMVKNTAEAPGTVADPVEPAALSSGSGEHAPARSAMAEEKITSLPTGAAHHVSSVVEKSGSNLLVLRYVLSKPEDKATLDRLADKIYSENKGYNYSIVTIRWHVGGNRQQAGLWATTSMTKTGSTFKYAK